MNPWLVPAALLAGLALGSVGLGLLVIFRAAALVSAAERRAHASRGECEAALRALFEKVEGLAGEIREIRKQPPSGAPVPAAPRPGFNLSKRTQALRMHRRGETREQIALTLEIPLQEVDLLLKVQQIVLSHV
jgi:type II secretory pathway component PulM